jgi:hypothetical protein
LFYPFYQNAKIQFYFQLLHFYFFEFFFLLLCRSLVGWWVGIAEKWRSPFFGVGWRCGVSETNTAKANFLKQIVRLLQIVKLREISNFIFFKVALLLVLRTHCTQRPSGLA